MALFFNSRSFLAKFWSLGSEFWKLPFSQTKYRFLAYFDIIIQTNSFFLKKKKKERNSLKPLLENVAFIEIRSSFKLRFQTNLKHKNKR